MCFEIGNGTGRAIGKGMGREDMIGKAREDVTAEGYGKRRPEHFGREHFGREHFILEERFPSVLGGDLL
jgi:hypothetical protein